MTEMSVTDKEDQKGSGESGGRCVTMERGSDPRQLALVVQI